MRTLKMKAKPKVKREPKAVKIPTQQEALLLECQKYLLSLHWSDNNPYFDDLYDRLEYHLFTNGLVDIYHGDIGQPDDN